MACACARAFHVTSQQQGTFLLKQTSLLPLIVAFVGVGLAHVSHAAEQTGNESELSLSLGAELTNRNLVGEASDKAKWSPTFGINYQKGRFFASTERGIGYNLLQEGGFHAGVAAGADPGRKDGDRKDSPRLVRMGKIDGTALAIVFAGYQGFDGLVKINATHLASAKSEYGSQTVISAALDVPLMGEKLSGSLSLSATHADRKYAQTYYGVTAAQAARSGNRVYNAKAGWITCDLSMALNYAIDKHWSTTASIGRHELRESAELSPLFATKKSNVGAMSVSYRF